MSKEHKHHEKKQVVEPAPPSSVGSVTGPGGMPMDKMLEAFKNPPKTAYIEPSAFPVEHEKEKKAKGHK